MSSEDLVAEFGSFREVLDHFTSKLSEEGVFLPAEANGGIGSEVAFQVRIRDGFSVLAGQGEIVQVTAEGVFLRLTYLDQPSLKLLPKLLEHYRRKGLPQLELPRIEPAAAVEVEPEEEVPEPTSVTLDDVEAELSRLAGREDAVEDEELALSDPSALPAESEAPAEVLLVEVEALDIDDAVIDEQATANEIDLGNLLEAEVADDQLSPEAKLPLANEPEAGPAIDPGLAWLPADAEEESRRDLWVILLLVLLGALIGAAFYFFVLRSETADGAQPTHTGAGDTLVLPAARTGPVPPPVQTVAKVEESVVPAAEKTPPPEPVTGLDRITWEMGGAETVVTLWGDGSFSDDQVDDFRVDGEAPREVVRIRGVERAFALDRIELGTEHVVQIRTGLHLDDNGSALHVVADLVDGAVHLSRTEATGQQLRVYFSKTG